MELIKNRGIGFYLVLLALIAGVVSLIRFALWASAHNAMDALVIGGLVAGVLADVVLVIHDEDYVAVLATAFYSIAFAQMLSDSVGSFVDMVQGINMFGDATQVGNIISIAIGMALSVVLSVVASFMRRGSKQ